MTLQESKAYILNEWDYEKNKLTPSEVSTSSHIKVWWRCSQNHSWEAEIANRYRKNYGCPYCAGNIPIIGVNDLFSTNPELEKSWDWDKNDELDPRTMKATSEKKAWWICEKGHSWETKILYRGARGHGCPYCAGQKVLKGYNDLESQYGEIVEEWDYEKNDINPSEITGRCNKKVWWKCSVCGNSYYATVYNRTYNNSGCSKCYARNKTSFPEQAIFFYIKQEFPDAMNGYTEDLPNGMELDIYIPSIKTAIEYDGEKWHSTKANVERDSRKYNWCKKCGINLIRIRESDAQDKNADIVIYVSSTYNQKMFEQVFEELNKILNSHIVPVIDRDRAEIVSQYKFVLRDNSLEKKYPIIAGEWDYEFNRGLVPAMFTPGSNDKVGWICPKGHRYMMTIANRVKSPIACSICTGKQVLEGYNDLQTYDKELASEWDYDLNGELRPTEVTWGSGKKVWWKCKKGHPSYKSYIYSRTGKEKTGCPVCANTKVLKGVNDFATICSNLIKEWDFEQNNISPDTILPGSNYEAWWKCKKGHRWKEKVGQRKGGRGCPYCSSHRVITGENDLKTKFPNIAEEWNYEKNKDLLPEDFLPQSNKKVWWKCKKGHEWIIAIASRQSNGCPYCSGRYAIPGETDIGTLEPAAMLDWDYGKNIDILPEQIKLNSHRLVWWKCHICGYGWEQKVCDKVKRKKSCPKCR